VDGVAMAMGVPGLVSRLAAGLPGAVPRGHGAGLRQSSRYGLRAGRRGCMLQHERPPGPGRPAPGRLGS